MRLRLLAVLAVGIFILFAGAAQAQLFKMKTGAWMEMDKADHAGHKWTVRIDVLEKVTLMPQGGPQTYFHLREKNYDPRYGDVLSDFYLRATDNAAYFFNGEGLAEGIAFKLGPVGTTWSWPEEGGTVVKKLVRTEQVTVPYGGPYTAYVYEHHLHRADGTDSPSDFEYIVPGLWFVKEVDYWVHTPAEAPYIAVLARAGFPNEVPSELLLLE